MNIISLNLASVQPSHWYGQKLPMLAFFLVFIKVACQKWKRLFHILSDIDNWACQRKKPNILTCKHKQQATPITRVVPTTYLLPTTDVYQVQSTFQIDDWVLATANFHYTISLFGGHTFIPIPNSRPRPWEVFSNSWRSFLVHCTLVLSIKSLDFSQILTQDEFLSMDAITSWSLDRTSFYLICNCMIAEPLTKNW